ncbi:MAG: GH1 family beta-glucosidase [Aquiluna sp.]|nr:GH1 family beta-glucosidase [Aquiluna sp.]
MKFPADFLWGSATSSYQIEGAATTDGRGKSIWDVFCETPGKVINADSGAVAIDHYNRYEQDVDVMSSLGLQAYRFSIAWPRIMPNGTGKIEKRGLDFYDRLVDKLLEKGIMPLATLYHWDLPAELEDKGGWTNRDSASWFADYAAVVHEALQDRVKMWATLNEPWVSAFLGYGIGIHAPGIKDPAKAFQAAHHLLLGHGKAIEVMRSQSSDSSLGIVLNMAPVYLEGTAPAGHPAHEAIELQDAILNKLWMNTLLKGQYPKTLINLGPVITDSIHEGDLAEISRPIDWMGVNYYQDSRSVPDDSAGGGVMDSTGNGALPGSKGVKPAPLVGEVTDFGWSTTPDGLRRLLVDMRDSYENLPPVYITENGAAYDDPIVDGKINDTRRIKFINEHLKAVHQAIEQGVDVRGYMHWSLFDNFEWAEGYRQRFGLVHVDFETQVRLPRESSWHYARIISNNGF